LYAVYLKRRRSARATERGGRITKTFKRITSPFQQHDDTGARQRRAQREPPEGCRQYERQEHDDAGGQANKAQTRPGASSAHDDSPPLSVLILCAHGLFAYRKAAFFAIDLRRARG